MDQTWWLLREVMFNRGMHKTNDLMPYLHAKGIQLSRPQVYRLVTGEPERLNMKILDALCEILECEPNDLIDFSRRRKSAAPEEKRAAGSDVRDLKPRPLRVVRDDG